MKALAVITARGGSKRIPRKNIKLFCGKPILSYSIQAALQSQLFSEVMVSTDDDEITDIAVQSGAIVPFHRSKKNSDDYAGTDVVILEVLESYLKKNISFDYVCCIYPTAPFITSSRIIEGFKKISLNDFDTVFPVCSFSFPVLRSLKKMNERIVPAWSEFYSKRSQDLETFYHDAGQFYWLKVDRFLSNRQLMTENTGFIELSELEVQDIDTLSDWKMAEFKFQFLHSKID